MHSLLQARAGIALSQRVGKLATHLVYDSSHVKLSDMQGHLKNVDLKCDACRFCCQTDISSNSCLKQIPSKDQTTLVGAVAEKTQSWFCVRELHAA